MPDEAPHLEARAFGLLQARRALTQALTGLAESDLWRAVDGLSAGAIAREAWQDEGDWVWPAHLPPPDLEPQPGLRGVFYALVRYRAVTENLLLAARDADLDRPYASQATRTAGRSAPMLAWILDHLMAADLDRAARLQAWRRRLQPDWPGITPELERARAAAAWCRGVGPDGAPPVGRPR